MEYKWFIFCFAVATTKVSFGTATDRELLPLKPPHSRAGNELGLRGQPNLAPGAYENHEVCQES